MDKYIDFDLYSHVIAISRRLCCNDDTYMDYAHDAIIRLSEAIPGYNKELPFKPWASIIAANCIIDQLRREGKRAEYEGWAVSPYAKPPLPKKDKDASFHN